MLSQLTGSADRGIAVLGARAHRSSAIHAVTLKSGVGHTTLHGAFRSLEGIGAQKKNKPCAAALDAIRMHVVEARRRDREAQYYPGSISDPARRKGQQQVSCG
jgi:hypothetical protein